MRDEFKNYDRWRLASPDDEAEETERQRLRRERMLDESDERRDREKDSMSSTRHAVRHD